MSVAWHEEQLKKQYTPPPPPVIDEHLESDRSHLHSYHVSLWIPIMQSLVTAAMFALEVLIISYIIKNRLYTEYWTWAVITFCMIASLSWVYFLARWLNLTVPLERIFNQDFNHDGLIGSSPAAPRMVRIEVKENAGKTLSFIELPDTPGARMFYRGLVNGLDNGMHKWTGKNKPLSENQYKDIRSILIDRRWAYWIGKPNSRDGWKLTHRGQIALEALLEPEPTPLPHQGDDL